MSIRRHMSAVRQYELIYIVPPETTEEALAELQTQVEAITQYDLVDGARAEEVPAMRRSPHFAGHPSRCNGGLSRQTLS